MKKKLHFKIIIIESIIILCIIFSVLDIHQYIIDMKYNFVNDQAHTLIESIEKDISDFESNIFYNVSIGIFNKDLGDEEELLLLTRHIKKFIFRYNSLIDSVYIFNPEEAYLFKFNQKSEFKKIHFNGPVQEVEKEVRYFNANDKNYIQIPISNLKGDVRNNIIIEFSIKKIIRSKAKEFNSGDRYWIWLLDQTDVEPLVYSEGAINERLSVSKIDKINEEIMKDYEGYTENLIRYDDQIKALTVYFPIEFKNIKYGLGFSIDKVFIVHEIFIKVGILLVLFLGMILLVGLYFNVSLNYTKKISDENKRSKESIEKIIKYLPIGIVLYNSDYQIKEVNNYFKKTFGMEELRGDDSIVEYIPEEYIENGREVFSINNGDNDVSLISKKIRVNFKGEFLTLFSFVDVTEIEKARKLAEESSKLKSQFVANVSHEIRTPMNGIIASTEILKEMTIEDPVVMDYIDIIESSANNLLELVNDILDLSKMASKKIKLDEKVYDFRKIIGNSFANFKSLVEQKGIDYILEIDETIPKYIKLDKNKLSQILINLIGNAIKFTDEGKILVRINNVEQMEKKVLLELIVADTGIGIPEDKLDNIFEVFYQVDGATDRKFEGTGLGTTITKNIIDLMKGEIQVESPCEILESDHPGTLFKITIEFDYVSEDSATIQEIRPNVKLSKPKRIGASDKCDYSVLLVEDNLVNLKLTERLLNDLGFCVVRATDGKEAIDKFSDEIDFILMDIQMPVIDGFEASTQIKEMNPEVPIVALTANNIDDIYFKAKAVGIEHFIEKPVKTDKILDLLKKIKKSF